MSDICACTPYVAVAVTLVYVLSVIVIICPPCNYCHRPHPFFVFGDGFCYMRTFWTRGYREAGPVDKKTGWKTLVPRTINAELVRKVDGSGLVLVLVRMYPLCTGELKN